MPYLVAEGVIANRMLNEHPPTLPQTAVEIVKQLDDALMYGSRELFKTFLSAAKTDIASSILQGALGVVVSVNEGYDGLKDAVEAYRDKQAKQRKTHIATGVAIGALGGAGIGISSAALADYFGATVLGAEYLGVEFACVLVIIYALAVERNSYILHQAKIEEKRAREAYEAILAQIQIVDETILYLEKQIKELNLDDTSADVVQTKNKLEDCVFYIKRMAELTDSLPTLFVEAAEKKEKYIEARIERLNAERELAFTVCELAAGLFILSAAIVALSLGTAVTFGGLAGALLIAGIAFGTLTKVFEKVDARKNYKMSNAIRTWFTDKCSNLSFFKSKNKLANEVVTPKLIDETIKRNDIKTNTPPTQPISIPEKGKPEIITPETPWASIDLGISTETPKTIDAGASPTADSKPFIIEDLYTSGLSHPDTPTPQSTSPYLKKFGMFDRDSVNEKALEYDEFANQGPRLVSPVLG